MSLALPIVTFHAIDYLRGVISFTPALFELSMRLFHQWGYRTLTLVDVIAYMRSHSAFPERSLVITFDDGYQSVYDHAFPILRRYAFSATVFLTVGANGKMGNSDRLPPMSNRPMLSWGEIREMQRYGVEFGAHTLSHPDLTRLSIELAEREICDSKLIIENNLNASVACFAYPYGRYNNQSREIVSRHFACACSDQLGLLNPRTDLYALERVDAYYVRSEMLLGLIPGTLFPLYVKARNIPRTIRRALRLA